MCANMSQKYMNVIKILCCCCTNKFSQNYNGSIYHSAKLFNGFFGFALVCEWATKAIWVGDRNRKRLWTVKSWMFEYLKLWQSFGAILASLNLNSRQV